MSDESETPANIKRFNETVGLVLAKLYANHPVRMNLGAPELLALDDNDTDPSDSDARIEFISETIEWLLREGLISSSRTVLAMNGPKYFLAVGLTGSGFAVLQRKDQSGKSFGKSFLDFAKGVGTDLAKEESKGLLKQHVPELAEAVGRLLGGIWKGTGHAG